MLSRRWRTAGAATRRRRRRPARSCGNNYSLAQAWNLVGRVAGSRRRAPQEPPPRPGSKHYCVRAPGDFPGRAQAGSESWLMVSAVHGPLPVEEGVERGLRGTRCSTAMTRRSARPLRRALFARGDPTTTSTARDTPAGRRNDRGIYHYPVGSAGRAGALLVEQLGGTPAQRSRRCTTASPRSTRAASAPTGRRSRASWPTRSSPRTRTWRLSASAARASGPPRPRTCSRRCSGGRRGRSSWRDAASSTRPRRWRERRSRSAEPTDLLTTHADALCDLAEVLVLAGRSDDSLAALRGRFASCTSARETSAPSRALAHARGTSVDTAARQRRYSSHAEAASRNTPRSTSRTGTSPEDKLHGRRHRSAERLLGRRADRRSTSSATRS